MIGAQRSFLLLIGDDGVVLLPPRHLVAAQPLFVEGHTDDTAQAIAQELTRAPDVPVCLLVDTLAQEFRREDLPTLSFFDRRKLLARRLGQAFPHLSLKTAVRQTDGSALLIGLDTHGALGFWQEQLKALPNPAGPIASLPVESVDLLRRLAPEAKKGWCLFLSWHRSGGLRQTVTRDGALIFTRLTQSPPSTTGTDFAVASFVLDIQATRDYLSRFGLGKDTKLALVGLLPKSMHAAMNDAQLDVASRLFFSPHEAAQTLKLPYGPGPTESMGEIVHGLWLGTRLRLTAPVMTENSRLDLQSRNLQRFGTMAALLAGLIALLTIGAESYTLTRLAYQANKTAAEIRTLEKDLAEAQQTLAPATEPLGRLRQAVERRRLFSSSFERLTTPMQDIAKALGDDAQVVAMSYNDATPQGPTRTFLLELQLRDVSGKPQHLDTDKQTALDRFNSLQERLQAILVGWSVLIERYPFPSTPQETLTNQNGQSADGPLIATYRLERAVP